MRKNRGWRAWGLAVDQRGPVLRSPEMGAYVPWLTYGERESWATCMDGYEHKVPNADCGCGFYSGESRAAVAPWLPPEVIHVLGKVERLGRVVEGAPTYIGTTWGGMQSMLGSMTGRETGPEYRSAGVRLVGTQRVRSEFAHMIPALEARYGVPFRVDETLGEKIDWEGDLREQVAGWQQLAAAASWTGKAAGLVLVNRERTHVVLQLRSQYVDHPGTWAFVGGAVEPGESATEAALREAWEEARIADVDVLGKVRRGSYTYVLAEADWTPEEDWVLPGSANLEADGAGWVSIAVLDAPETAPSMRLHPKLAKAWPGVREALR